MQEDSRVRIPIYIQRIQTPGSLVLYTRLWGFFLGFWGVAKWFKAPGFGPGISKVRILPPQNVTPVLQYGGHGVMEARQVVILKARDRYSLIAHGGCMLKGEINGHKFEAQSMSEYRRKVSQIEAKIFGSSKIEDASSLTVADLNKKKYSVSCESPENPDKETEILNKTCKRR